MPELNQQERDRIVRLMGVFHPEATRRRTALHENGERVVHYTSAEAAMKIISSQTMWLRNTNCMSDYMEVTLGFRHLQRFFSDEKRRQRLVAALDACHPKLGAASIQHVNEWVPFLDTYRTMCIAPNPEFRRLLEKIREVRLAA